MRYLSVCSGIGTDAIAWKDLPWKCAGFAEISPFPRAVLSHRFPEIPLYGDFTTLTKEQVGSIDLLVGGTPCQSFSISGLRKGMEDARGNLALEFVRLADRLSPKFIVWENVPGVLSSNGGRDFGSFIGALAFLGYGVCWRICDAQYWGVAQRRRRVFLVAVSGGDFTLASKILFDTFTMPKYSRQSGAPRQNTAPIVEESIGDSDQYDKRSTPLTFDLIQITHPLNASRVEPGLPFPTLTTTSQMHVAYVVRSNQTGANGSNVNQDVMFTLDTTTPPPAVVYNERHRGSELGITAASQVVVRRITPREAERLQGLPDDHTLVPWRNGWATDNLRYKAIGNGMAAPVLQWIGERIESCRI